jgi:membrane-associated protease RseP (regulator of RpoE activity)
MSFATVLHECTLLWWYTFVVGVIVIVHEIGHYSVARLFNVRVQVFSFGFGPRLFGVRRGETDFRCSAIPLGGYVSMADGPPEDSNTLAAKRRWQRILIALGGSLNQHRTQRLCGCSAIYGSLSRGREDCRSRDRLGGPNRSGKSGRGP